MVAHVIEQGEKSMQSQKLFLSLLTASLVWGFHSPTSLAEQPSSASSEPASGTTLKGEVVKVQVSLNNLSDARLAINRVRKAAANLYDEVTRKEMSLNLNPNVVGSNVMMTIPQPVPTGSFLPPRKKWMNQSMVEINPILHLFKEDVDNAIETNRQTEVSEAVHQQLQPLRLQAFETVKASFSTFKELEKLTGAQTYDNKAIAAAAKALDSQMKDLDRDLKKGVAILQKEARKSNKSHG